MVEGLDTYFIEPTSHDYFRRGCVYSDGNKDPERFGYFSKMALEWLLQVRGGGEGWGKRRL